MVKLILTSIIKQLKYKSSRRTAKLLHVLSPATVRCRARKYCFTGVVGMLRFIPRRWLPCCRRRLLPKGRHFLARRPLEFGLGSSIHVVSPPHSKICLKEKKSSTRMICKMDLNTYEGMPCPTVLPTPEMSVTLHNCHVFEWHQYVDLK